MKRIVAITAVLLGWVLLGGGVRAQDSLDVDTLWGPHSHYMYLFWDDSAYECHHDSMLCIRYIDPVSFDEWSSDTGNAFNSLCYCEPVQTLECTGFPRWIKETAAKYHVDTAVQIVGLAVVMANRVWHKDPKSPSPELKLYKPMAGGAMNLIESRSFDTNVYQHLMYMTDGLNTPLNNTPSRYLPCAINEYYKVYEVYFDTAVTMTDSFYVAWVHNDYISDPNVYTGYWGPMTMWEIGSHPSYPGTFYHCPPRYPDLTYRNLGTTPDEPWMTFVSNVVAFLMPILQYEGDTCMPVSGLRWRRWGEDAAWVQWDSVGWQKRWQVSYGPEGTPPGEGTVVNCADPSYVLYGLDTMTRYSFYVRARCDELPHQPWTEWSGLTMDMARGGIDGAALPGLTVTPNPTTGRLAVQCTEVMSEVEVYSLLGRLLQSQPCSGPTAEVDVSTLPADSYVLQAKTGQGPVSRKVTKK